MATDTPQGKRVRVTIDIDGREVEVCTGVISGRSPWMFWHKIRPDGGELHLPPAFRIREISEEGQ